MQPFFCYINKGEKHMEYIDIVFNGISAKDIDTLIKDDLKISEEIIIRSHFYTEEAGDFEYYDKIDLVEYFSSQRTSNMLLSALKLNKKYNNVMVVITSDENNIYVTLNIGSEQVKSSDTEELQRCLHSVFEKYDLKSIYAGDENSKEEDAFWVIK